MIVGVKPRSENNVIVSGASWLHVAQRPTERYHRRTAREFLIENNAIAVILMDHLLYTSWAVPFPDQFRPTYNQY
jgi:hypothetical protein